MGDQKPTANERNTTKRAIIRCPQGEMKRFTFITPAFYFRLGLNCSDFNFLFEKVFGVLATNSGGSVYLTCYQCEVIMAGRANFSSAILYMCDRAQLFFQLEALLFLKRLLGALFCRDAGVLVACRTDGSAICRGDPRSP